jgi:hypothetical protein
MSSADSLTDDSASPTLHRRAPSWLAAGGLFLLIGFAVNAAVIAVRVDLYLVWETFLHQDPDHAIADSLVMIAMSPFAGMAFASVIATLPIVVGACVMALVIRISGKLPLWSSIVVIPLCIAAFAVQSYLTRNGEWFDTPPGRDIVIAQILFPLICWALCLAISMSPASPERARLLRVLYLGFALAILGIVAVAGATAAIHWNPWHPEVTSNAASGVPSFANERHPEVTWNAAGGVPKFTLANERQTKIPSGSVSWSPDGTRLATLSIYGGLLAVQDAAGHVEQEGAYPKLPSPYCPCFLSDAREMIVSRDVKSDVAFSVVDIAAGRTVFEERSLETKQPNRPDLVALALSSDGTRLAAVHNNVSGEPISLYDTKTWQRLSTLNGMGAGRVVFSTDGSKLTFSSSDTFFVIDAGTGQTVSTLPIHAAGFVALSPDNSMAAVEEMRDAMPKAIRIFRLSDGAEIATYPAFVHGPNCLENRDDCGLASPILWDRNGRFLIFPDGHNTIRIWNPFAGNNDGTTIRVRYFAGGIALSKDGKLAISNGDFLSVFDIGK